MNTLLLNDADAASFIRWQKYRDKFELLVETQVFDVKNGSAEIHFDPQGEIRSIDLHAKVYRRVVIPMVTVDKK